MDSVTHIFLGGAVAQAFFGRKLGKIAFVLGGLAASMPDFDVFIHTGDSLRDHLFHRHFMHAMVMVPVLAAFTMLPFLFSRKLRPRWREMFFAALLACATHTLLDTLTSYGTMIFWPFTTRRFALDIVAVIDPFYTIPLIIGTVMTLRRPAKLQPARVALAVSLLYLGFASWQHHRAIAAQEMLIASRGRPAENPRVLPQVGAAVNYRSIYASENRIYADGIRVLPLTQARVKPGSSTVRASREDASVQAFATFADGFVASVPDSPGTIGDMRYTMSPEGFDAIWGVEVHSPGDVEWRLFPRRELLERLWRETVRPKGYLPVAAVPGRTVPE